MLEVWNKLDLLDPDAREAQAAVAARRDHVFAISALTGEGIPSLLDAVSERLSEEKTARDLHLAFDDGRKRAWLHDQGVVTSETQDEAGWALSVLWTARQEKRFRDL